MKTSGTETFSKLPHCPEEETGQSGKVGAQGLTAEKETVVSRLRGQLPGFLPVFILSYQIFFSSILFLYAQVPGMQEILLIGFYQPDEPLTRFLEAAQQEFNLPIRCLCPWVVWGLGGSALNFWFLGVGSIHWTSPHTLGGFLLGHL